VLCGKNFWNGRALFKKDTTYGMFFVLYENILNYYPSYFVKKIFEFIPEIGWMRCRNYFWKIGLLLFCRLL